MTETQEQVVLRLLRQAGARGLHSHEIHREGWIVNAGERIARLRRQGHAIRVSERERLRDGGPFGVRYFLEAPGSKEPPRASKDLEAAAERSLFDLGEYEPADYRDVA